MDTTKVDHAKYRTPKAVRRIGEFDLVSAECGEVQLLIAKQDFVRFLFAETFGTGLSAVPWQ